LAVLTFAIAATWQLLAWLREWQPVAGRRRVCGATYVLFAVVAAWLLFDILCSLPRIKRYVPTSTVSDFLRGWSILYGGMAVAVFFALAPFRWAWNRAPAHDRGRRRFLAAAGAVAAVTPAAVLVHGVVTRKKHIRLREADLGMRGLPRDLHGLRLVQITDVHLSPFFTPADLQRAIDIANETRAHIALVTGDLINSRHDPLDQALELLRGLRAEAGVFGCHGNHEAYAFCEGYATKRGAQLGIRFLDHSAETLRFGKARLRLAGVRHQSIPDRYLYAAEELLEPGAFNILLSHNPDVFPKAAGIGFDLTISGHTHGGQVNLEIRNWNLNIARIYTPYVDGIYRIDASAIFVSRGLGTVGPPLRLGAPPEVALIRLCAT
jgi:predicted MPP superfamily phosphohydrolase